MIIDLSKASDSGVVLDEWYEGRMRVHRNQLLSQSDWTQMPDSPLSGEERDAWTTYRQALRDFPATWIPGPTADFPDPPA